MHSHLLTDPEILLLGEYRVWEWAWYASHDRTGGSPGAGTWGWKQSQNPFSISGETFLPILETFLLNVSNVFYFLRRPMEIEILSVATQSVGML